MKLALQKSCYQKRRLCIFFTCLKKCVCLKFENNNKLFKHITKYIYLFSVVFSRHIFFFEKFSIFHNFFKTFYKFIFPFYIIACPLFFGAEIFLHLFLFALIFFWNLDFLCRFRFFIFICDFDYLFRRFPPKQVFSIK